MALDEFEFRGEFKYLRHASDEIYSRMADVLSNRLVIPSSDRQLTDFGTDARHGYVYCMSVADTRGLDPAKFMPITTEVIVPTSSLENQLGPTIMEQLQGIDFSLPEPPAFFKLVKPRPRSIVTFGHSLATLAFLREKVSVSLPDLVSDQERSFLPEGTQYVTTNWAIPLDKEGVWYTISRIDETVKEAAWEPHELKDRRGREKAYWAACFFAASNHLLSEPHMEQTFRERAQAVIERIRGRERQNPTS